MWIKLVLQVTDPGFWRQKISATVVFAYCKCVPRLHFTCFLGLLDSITYNWDSKLFKAALCCWNKSLFFFLWTSLYVSNAYCKEEYQFTSGRKYFIRVVLNDEKLESTLEKMKKVCVFLLIRINHFTRN